jgi:hypothetical protein
MLGPRTCRERERRAQHKRKESAGLGDEVWHVARLVVRRQASEMNGKKHIREKRNWGETKGDGHNRDGGHYNVCYSTEVGEMET